MSEELPINSAVEFTRELEEFVQRSGCTYLEALEYFVDRKGYEPETVASLIARNQAIKSKLQEEAELLNLVKKSARLPI